MIDVELTRDPLASRCSLEMIWTPWLPSVRSYEIRVKDIVVNVSFTTVFFVTLVPGVFVSKSSGSLRSWRRSDRSTWIAVCEESIPCRVTKLSRCTKHSGYCSQSTVKYLTDSLTDASLSTTSARRPHILPKYLMWQINLFSKLFYLIVIMYCIVSYKKK